MGSSTQPRDIPVVETSPCPSNYRFVPKGNVYITANVRKETHASGRPLYLVTSKHNPRKTLGVRCPLDVYNRVHDAEKATRASRQAAVDKHDAAERRQFEAALREEYPNIPEAEVGKLVKRALAKRSGRVGRTARIDVREKARLAVWAHVRHCHTEYDALLRGGVKREHARVRVQAAVQRVLRGWKAEPKPMNGKRKSDEANISGAKRSKVEGGKATVRQTTTGFGDEAMDKLSASAKRLSLVDIADGTPGERGKTLVSGIMVGAREKRQTRSMVKTDIYDYDGDNHSQNRNKVRHDSQSSSEDKWIDTSSSASTASFADDEKSVYSDAQDSSGEEDSAIDEESDGDEDVVMSQNQFMLPEGSRRHQKPEFSLPPQKKKAAQVPNPAKAEAKRKKWMERKRARRAQKKQAQKKVAKPCDRVVIVISDDE